jgi:hypothetical protein
MSKENEEFIRKTDADKLTATLRELAKEKAIETARAMGKAEAYDHSAELCTDMLVLRSATPTPQPHVAPKVIPAMGVAPPRNRTAWRRGGLGLKKAALDYLRDREGFTRVSEITPELIRQGIETDDKTVKHALDKEVRAGRLDRRGTDAYRVIPLAEVEG